MRTTSASAAAGYSLIELLTVLLLLGILVSLAAPAFTAPLQRMKMDRVLNAVRADLFYARALAVRAGERVEIQFTPATRNVCLQHYEIVVLADSPRVAKRVALTNEASGVCLSHNGANPLIYSSRGHPSGVVARSFFARAGSMEDTLRLSQAGRSYRRY